MLTVDLIESFINSLSLTANVISFSDDDTNTTLIVDNVYHTRFNMTIDVDGTNYTVDSVDHDLNQIIVRGVIDDPVLVTVPNPFYFHGTPYATSAHISYLEDPQKVPMIYLMEILREEEKDIFSSIDREANIKIFLLDNMNYADWDTDQHYSEVIIGLEKLWQAFKAALYKDGRFYTDEITFTKINHIKWGQYATLKGHIQSIFNERLDGIEIDFVLPIRKPC